MSRIFVIYAERFHRHVLGELARRGIETALFCASERKGYEEIRALVPGAVHLSTRDAMAARVPPALEPEVRPASADDLLALAPYESRALLMIERINHLGRPLLEMRRLYVRYVSIWQTLLDRIRPDAVLFQSPPHMGYDYVLWALARRRGIRTLIVERTLINERLILYEDPEQMPGPGPADEAHGPGAAPLSPAPEVAASTLGDPESEDDADAGAADEAAPPPASTSLFDQLNREASDLREIRRALSIGRLVRLLFNRELPSSLSRRQFSPVAPTDPSMLQIRLLELARATNLRRALAFYDAAARPVDLDAPFVYVPLHFQPERTTLPAGGLFPDQAHSLEILLAALPSGWRAYVKEHPRQFRSLLAWNRVRDLAFYQRLARDPRVALVPLDTSSAALVERCRAVVTTTGTAGWEAVGIGRPAIVFGFPWYLRCPGVVRVSSVEGCAAALAEVEAGRLAVHPSAVRDWTARLLRDHSFRGAFSDRLLAMSSLTPEENGVLYAEAVARALRS